MSAQETARSAALRALVSFRKSGGKNSDPFFRLDDRRDAALARAIFWGVLQNRALIDFYIGSFSSASPQEMEPLLLDILRVGAYQIVFLDRVPARAAVHEAVEQTKLFVNPGAARLANAVLRRLAENPASMPEPPRADTAKYLSVRYSHPEWLCRRVLDILPEAECAAFFSTNNALAPLTLQVNTLETDRTQLLARFKSLNIDARAHDWEPGTVEIEGGADPLSLPPFVEGLATVQDPAARTAVTAADLLPGMRLIDVCAAPGGKSFAAAMDMKNTGEIFSLDLNKKKLVKIEQGAKRLNIGIIRTGAHDARIFDAQLEESADAVIADVPCSGFGTIRKKPDIRYKGPDEIAGLPAVQRLILENVSRYVRPGGVLIYSTCTILPEENGQVTDSFLDAHPEYRPEEFTAAGGAIRSDGGAFTFWPHRDGSDGFYIRKMRRT